MITIPRARIEARRDGGPSLMPAGMVNALASRQQFLDLLRYLMEIAEQGPARACALRPDPALVAPPLPEYERRLDHAGLIADLDAKNLRRGEAIYTRVCTNCHGTADRPGSLPDAPRFASAALKNGSDPYSLYRTITDGFGRMAPQSWMVPRQKYDVIHYIRETYLRPSNRGQYVAVNRTYLDRLPTGDTRGPSPTAIEPWVAMDYGSCLLTTIEAGEDLSNVAYKGIAVRLDPGQGASLAGVPGSSMNTTRSASPPPGPAGASSTGIASASTAGTRSIRGSSASVTSTTPTDLAGPTRKTPASGTVESSAATTVVTGRCPATGPITAACIATAIA